MQPFRTRQPLLHNDSVVCAKDCYQDLDATAQRGGFRAENRLNAMSAHRTFLVFLASLAGGSAALSAADAAAVPERRPKPQSERVLLSSSDPAFQAAPYLAFPAVLDLGHELLISFKHGRSHANDPGASLDLLRFDPTTGQQSGPRPIARLAERIMQMGEWARFANGDIANYIDAQQAKEPARVGLRMVRSTDGGRTFGPLERVGVIDGVEYGYAFDAITAGGETWLLVMTFSNLTGGVSIHPPRPQAGPVDVIHTTDNGRTWHRVRSLTREFGNVPINESAFVRFNDGFLVTTRGYDNRERLHVTDAQFHVLGQSELNRKHPFVMNYVGRPRLFAREGRIYLLGRNWTRRGPMQLCLFRLDATGLEVESYAILDNAADNNVTDGYYAAGVFRGTGSDTRFHVVTYRGLDRQPPSLVQLEFLWSEVK